MQRYRSAVAVFMLMLGLVFGSSATPAAAADIGFRDFQFGSSCNSTPTGEKPESKLWWNDNPPIWWGSLCATDNHYHIFRLNLANQTWIDTGTMLDDRPTTKADTLWDNATQKLYVASHVFTTSGAATSSSSSWARLYRFTYDQLTDSYTPDDLDPTSNVWVNISRGKSETLVLEKAKNEQLWVTYVESGKVMVNHSGGSGLAYDGSWGMPYALGEAGASNLSSDDIASIISFDRPTNSPKIGVLWSNQNDKKMYFATHVDSAADTAWSSFGVYVSSSPSPAAADDHINIKLQSDGVGVYAVTKTSNSTSSQPLIVLLSCIGGCDTAGNWHADTVYTRGDNHTRAILLIDTTHNILNIFSTTPESGGNIYRKTTPISNISFAPGHGDLFIKTAGDSKINNPTSTKQNVTSTTGLVILASDSGSRRYMHNYDPLGSGPPPPPTADFSGTPTSGTAPLTVNFSDLSSGSPISWAWDFDNDGITDSTAQNPSFIYNNPGTYTVKLIATNAIGSDTKTRTNYITVNSAGGPTADFSGTPTSGTAPLTVNFSDLSSGSPISWAWDFDNNGITDSTAQNPSFIYNNPGTYTVKLIATNAIGSDTKTKTNYITVTSGGGGTATTNLLPNGDGAHDATIKDQSGGTVNLYTAIDDTIAAADDGTTYIRNNNSTSGNYFALLSDLPANFASMSALSIDIRARTVNRVDDDTIIYAQLYKADGVTALSDEVAVASNPGPTGWVTVANVALSGVAPGTKADWDGAQLRLRWAYTAVGTVDSTQVRVTAVQLGATYNTTGP
jgi:PKD repeat protein